MRLIVTEYDAWLDFYYPGISRSAKKPGYGSSTNLVVACGESMWTARFSRARAAPAICSLLNLRSIPGSQKSASGYPQSTATFSTSQPHPQATLIPPLRPSRPLQASFDFTSLFLYPVSRAERGYS
jgi:hypothetical protein